MCRFVSKNGFLQRIKNFLTRDVVEIKVIPVDARFRRFNGPKNINVEGEILGKAKKPCSPWKSGTSHVLTVLFSESVERNFWAYEILERDGRRTLLFREQLEGELGE